MKPRLAVQDVFNETIRGVFGSFGWGGGVQVNYIQAAINVSDLKKISLVGEIEGSDRWPVRDLFQREVDTERVEQGLLPWLQDGSRVKFFNPLTLVLIPFDPTGKIVLPQIPHLQRQSVKDTDGDEWIELSSPDAYRFRWRVQDGGQYTEFAEVSWCTRRVQLVAIDGQHRLSALKRYLRDSQGPGYETFLKWHIPIVIAGLNKEGAAASGHTALDVIRHVFVTINTQAQVPTRTRQILLDDVNPVHICVQELLQRLHENDLRSPEAADPRIPPLSLFDWRGATRAGKETHSPIALKSASEIADWFEWYLLGEPFDLQQLEILGLGSSDELRGQFESGTLRPGDHLMIREAFRRNILDGLLHLLQEFAPYRAYIEKVRAIEKGAEAASDASRHAIAYLRFGTHRGSQAEQQDIQRSVDEIVQDILDAKEFPQLLADDIGMRGVASAFGILRPLHGEWSRGKHGHSWDSFAHWFVKHLNEMEAAGWFTAFGHPDRQYITNTPAGDVLNFKLGHANKALGAFTVIVVAAYAAQAKALVTASRFEQIWNRFALDERGLRSTLRSGYRRRYMDELAEKHPGWSRKKREEEALPLANKAAAAHLTRFKKKLDGIVEA